MQGIGNRIEQNLILNSWTLRDFSLVYFSRKGKHSYSNGDVYEGNFSDGEKNGQGSENKQIKFFV